jgi:SAM-dependent methyltransferase
MRPGDSSSRHRVDDDVLRRFGLSADDFRDRRCPLCLSSHESQVEVLVGDRHRMGLRTVVCTSCSLLFSNPAPVQAALTRFYSGTYRSHYAPRGAEQMRADRRRIRATLRWAQLHLPPRGRVVDVGADDGYALEALGRARPQLEALGVEPGSSRSSASKDAAGARFVSDLEEVPTGHADLVLCLHVLEHSLEPLALLGSCRRVLKVGGRLLLEVPNVSRFRQGLGFVHLAHLQHFVPVTLSMALRRAGFSVETMTPSGVGWRPGQSVIRAVARRSAGADREALTGADWRAAREAFLFSAESRSTVHRWLRDGGLTSAAYGWLLRARARIARRRRGLPEAARESPDASRRRGS